MTLHNALGALHTKFDMPEANLAFRSSQEFGVGAVGAPAMVRTTAMVQTRITMQPWQKEGSTAFSSGSPNCCTNPYEAITERGRDALRVEEVALMQRKEKARG